MLEITKELRKRKMKKEDKRDIFKNFVGRILLLGVVPLILLILCGIDLFLQESWILNDYSKVWEKFADYLEFSTETMQTIWGYQITVTGIVTVVCTHFLDKANERRLGLSFKYLFFHNSIFGKYNVLYLAVINIFSLVCGGVYAYLFMGVNHLLFQQMIKILFIINVIIQLRQITRMLNLLVISRYKESVIYDKMQEMLDKPDADKFKSKFIGTAVIDYESVLEAEGYNQYFTNEVLTLIKIYEKYEKAGEAVDASAEERDKREAEKAEMPAKEADQKAEKSSQEKDQKVKEENDLVKERILKNISARIYQRGRSFGNEYKILKSIDPFNDYLKEVILGERRTDKERDRVYIFASEHREDIVKYMNEIITKEKVIR